MTCSRLWYAREWAIMKARVVSATEFKAKCLAFLDEMEDQAVTITITKRGRPVAVLSPTKRKPGKSPKGAWAGKVQIQGDIVNDPSGLWDVLGQR
jgi:prevent-host-death family protein